MQPTSCIRLGREASMFHATRGTVIVSTQGSILVSESGVATDTHFTINDGECHIVQRSGWVRLQANASASGTALISTALPAASLWRRWWQRRTFAPVPLRE